MNNQKDIIYEKDILKYLTSKNPKISKTSLKWGLFHYIQDNGLVRVGVKQYRKDAKIYSYEYKSLFSVTIDNYLEKMYSEVKSIVWESRQLNEWLNLLLNTNIIYVEVEKDCVDYVFSSLNEVFGKEHLILLNPSNSIISQYLRDDLVVVKTLYSKSPVNKSNRKVKLEKLIVDVVAGDFTFDTRGIEDIILGIKDTYTINVDKMISYASRRRVLELLDKIYGDNK